LKYNKQQLLLINIIIFIIKLHKLIKNNYYIIKN